jgi:hypothetical protein
MAVIRTVLPRKGFVQPQHGLTGYEQDFDGDMAFLDANVAFMSDLDQSQNANANTALMGPVSGGPAAPSRRALVVADLPLAALLALTLPGEAGINGVVSGFALSTSGSLTPGLAVGALFAQGALYAPTISPAPGPAPASATNYLFYNSTSGFYYQTSAVAAQAGDALIGQVVTSSSAVTGVTQGTKIFSQISVSPSGSGNFTVQHFLGRAPIGAIIRMTSSVSIYWQTPTDVDATNLYLTASAAGTAKILVF